MIDLSRLRSKFRAKYSTEPRIFRAPGRVNIIGEHTDYNDGFVLPCAIDFATYVAGSSRPDRSISVASLNFENELEFDLDGTNEPPAKDWTKFIQGVAMRLYERETGIVPEIYECEAANGVCELQLLLD